MASFSGFFEVVVGSTFWKIESEKEAHSTRTLFKPAKTS
jgi:hypothetical protein